MSKKSKYNDINANIDANKNDNESLIRKTAKKSPMNKCNDECTLCLSDLAGRISVELACKHMFHRNCLCAMFTSELESRTLCPLCRRKISEVIIADVVTKEASAQDAQRILAENVARDAQITQDALEAAEAAAASAEAEAEEEAQRIIARNAAIAARNAAFFATYNATYIYTRDTIPMPPNSFILTNRRIEDFGVNNFSGARITVYEVEDLIRGQQNAINRQNARFKIGADVNEPITAIGYNADTYEQFGEGYYADYPNHIGITHENFDFNNKIYVVTVTPGAFSSLINSLYLLQPACTISGGSRKKKQRKLKRTKRMKQRKSRRIKKH